MKHINAKYKLLALVPLMVLTGCKKAEKHANVVTGIGNLNNDKVVSITDIKTNIDRIYIYHGTPEYPYAPWIDYIQIGDTVAIYADVVIYQHSRILHNKKHATLRYDNDSIIVRQERDKMNKIKHEMQQTR